MGAVHSYHWTQSSGDTITANEKPPIFTEAVISAYEIETGFKGLGIYLEKAGKIRILRSNHGNS